MPSAHRKRNCCWCENEHVHNYVDTKRVKRHIHMHTYKDNIYIGQNTTFDDLVLYKIYKFLKVRIVKYLCLLLEVSF